MKKLALGVLTILSLSAAAQEIGVGPSVSRSLNTDATSYGIRLNYTGPADKGISYHVPVKLELGNDVKKAAMGLGISTGELNDIFKYSAAVALEHLSYSENFATKNKISEAQRRRMVATFMQEINFQLSQKLSLGLHLDVDLLNAFKLPGKIQNVTTVEDLNNGGYKQAGGGGYYDPSYRGTQPIIYPAFKTNAERDQAIENNKNNYTSIKNSSATSFGLSLKIRLGK